MEGNFVKRLERLRVGNVMFRYLDNNIVTGCIITLRVQSP